MTIKTLMKQSMDAPSPIDARLLENSSKPSLRQKRFLFQGVLVLLNVFLLTTGTSAQTILSYSDHEPLGGMRTRLINEVLFPAIEKESHGRLKVEAHWNSELATGYNALKLAREGRSADMAIVVPEYAPNELPLHQIFKSFPVGPNTGEKQLTFFHQVYKEIPAFPKELEKENVVNVLFGIGYPVAFFSAKSLHTLDDIKGSKWRTASFWHRDFLQNAGATSVSIPWGEGVFKALQEGTLDGLIVNIDSGYDVNAQKAAPNVLTSKDLWLGHVYLLVMNRDTWNGLSKDDQAAIQRAARIADKASGPALSNSFNMLTEKLKQDGAKIRVLEKKELNAWETATRYQEVQSAWATAQEGKGVNDVGRIMQQVGLILKDNMK